MKKNNEKRLMLEFYLDDDPYKSAISYVYNSYSNIERENLYLTNKGLFTTVFFDKSNGYHLECSHIILSGCDVKMLGDFLEKGINEIKRELCNDELLFSYEYDILLRYLHGNFSKLRIKPFYKDHLLIYTFFIDNQNFSKQEIINIGFVVCDLLKEMERFIYEQNENVTFKHFIKWFNVKFIKKLQFLSQYYQIQSEEVLDELEKKLDKLKYKKPIMLNSNFGFVSKYTLGPDRNEFVDILNYDDNLPF